MNSAQETLQNLLSSLPLKITAYRNDPRRIRMRTTDRIHFLKRLALYLRSGIPIAQALDLLTDEARPGAQLILIRSVAQNVRHGVPLSSALRTFPRSFRGLHVQLVSVGEASGTLAQNLTHLADILTRRATLIRKIQGALVYPAVILTGTVMVSSFLIFGAFPKIIPLFRGFHTQLPLSTRLLMAISGGVRSHGLLLILGLTICIGSAVYAYRFGTVRTVAHTAAIHIPLLGSIVQSYYLSTIFRMISVLLSSGTRIDSAVLLVREGLTNIPYRASLDSAHASILAGERLGSSLQEFPQLYPHTAVQLIQAGEMTGTLSQAGITVADLYEEQLTEQAQALSSLLEPALMVIMGFVVGFVALAIIAPMYSLTQNLSVH